MLDVLFSGLVLSSVYGLVAIGISLTWASIGMLNLSQGFVFTAGGYSAFLFSQMAGNAGIAGPVLSIGTVLAGMLGAAVFGLLVGAVAFLPLQDRDNFRTRSPSTVRASVDLRMASTSLAPVPSCWPCRLRARIDSMITASLKQARAAQKSR